MRNVFSVSSALMVFFASWSLCSVVFSQTVRDTKTDELPSLWTRSTGNDWPGFLGLGRDGISQETGFLTDWSGEKLKQVWTIDTGQGYGIGAVSKGRYFHFDRGDNGARLRCFNVENGKELWDYEYPSNYEDMYGYDSGPRTSPVVDGNRVYILGVEGRLTCLTADKGAEVWNVDVANRFGVVQNFFGVGGTPIVYKDKLLVMVGGSGGKARTVSANNFPGIEPAQSGLVAFDKMNGELKFETIDDLASYSSVVVAKIQGRDIALVWARGGLHGINPDDGKSVFKYPFRARILESVNASTPVVHRDQIFLSECYGLGSVLLKASRSSVEEVWKDAGRREKSLETHWNTPVLFEGHLYASSGRHSGDAELRCIEFETGKVKWKERGFSRSSVTLVDDHLLVLSEYGKLLLVKATPEKFEVVTQLPTNDETKMTHPCWSAPIVSHGLMLVRGKRKVFCYDLIPN